MSSYERRYRRKHQRERLARQGTPLGFFFVEEHGLKISVLRYYTEEQREEIVFMSQMAQADCANNHKDKPGICCKLLPATLEDWVRWH